MIPDMALYDDENDRKVIDVMKDHKKGKWYTIKKRIGYGSFSSVYLASREEDPHYVEYDNNNYDVHKQRLYAIKVVSETMISPSEILAGFVLNHRNLSRMEDYFAIGHHYYLIYEFIDGADLQVLWDRANVEPILGLSVPPPSMNNSRKSLGRVLFEGSKSLTAPREGRRNRFLEDAFRGIFAQIINGLLHCHLNGIVHRDVKMENVVLYGPNYKYAKVVDFGFAFFVKSPLDLHTQKNYKCNLQEDFIYKMDPVTGVRRKVPLIHKDFIVEENRYVGTKDYCAPEVELGAVEQDKDLYATDVYSLGILLHAVLTGDFPKNCEDLSEYIAMQREAYMRKPNMRSFKDLYSDLNFVRDLLNLCDLKLYQRAAYLSPEAIDLIERMVYPIPAKRITLQDICEHKWLKGAF